MTEKRLLVKVLIMSKRNQEINCRDRYIDAVGKGGTKYACNSVRIRPKLKVMKTSSFVIEAVWGQDVLTEFLEIVVDSIGVLGVVRHLQERVTIEVLDINPTASMDENISNLINVCNDMSMKVGNVSMARDGMTKVNQSMTFKMA